MNLTLTDDLSGLASGTEHRSKMARFREIFDQVRVALDAGVRHLAIRDVLARHGLDLSVATFDVMVSRLRRERGIPLPRHARRAHVDQAQVAPHASTGPAPAPLREVAAPQASAQASASLSSALNTTAGAVSERSHVGVVMPTRVLAPQPVLPDDWLTAKLSPEQSRLLMPEQRQARLQAKFDKYMPNPLKGFVPAAPKPVPAAPAGGAASVGAAAEATQVSPRGVSTGLATPTTPHPLLPDDWLDGELTPEQARLLTPEQRRARRTARSNRFMLAGWFPTAKRAPAAHADQSGETGGESSKDADTGAAR